MKLSGWLLNKQSILFISQNSVWLYFLASYGSPVLEITGMFEFLIPIITSGLPSVRLFGNKIISHFPFILETSNFFSHG